MITYNVSELWIFLDCHHEPEHDFFITLYIKQNTSVNFFTLGDRFLCDSSIFFLFIELDKVNNVLYLEGNFPGVMTTTSWNLPAAYMLQFFKYYCSINTSWGLNTVYIGQWEKNINQILHTKIFFWFFIYLLCKITLEGSFNAGLKNSLKFWILIELDMKFTRFLIRPIPGLLPTYNLTKTINYNNMIPDWATELNWSKHVRVKGRKRNC